MALFLSFADEGHLAVVSNRTLVKVQDNSHFGIGQLGRGQLMAKGVRRM
jgi:hypothetical protein